MPRAIGWITLGILGLAFVAWMLVPRDPAPIVPSVEATIAEAPAAVDDPDEDPEIILPLLAESGTVPEACKAGIDGVPGELFPLPVVKVPFPPVHPDPRGMPAPRRSPEEEAALDGLRWLAAHQGADGSWSFDHGRNNTHAGPVNNAGTLKSTTGATGLVLLAFLEVGQTHREGRFKDNVRRGLDHLLQQGKKNTLSGVPAGDLRGEEGDLMCQAWATLALTEAHALSQDRDLRQPAQDAVHYILSVQHEDGGWGRAPKESGECLVTVWTIMALKSGHLAYLSVPPQSVAGAIKFLNSIQSDQGARYGSTKPGDGDAACTAGGLLCRMYLGWKRDNPALERGIAELHRLGPSANDPSFNYFATEALLHWGGPDWKTWETALRRQAFPTQTRTGTYTAEKGSWFFPEGRLSKSGGRLCDTALETMILSRRFDLRTDWRRRNEAADDDF